MHTAHWLESTYGNRELTDGAKAVHYVLKAMSYAGQLAAMFLEELSEVSNTLPVLRVTGILDGTYIPEDEGPTARAKEGQLTQKLS